MCWRVAKKAPDYKAAVFDLAHSMQSSLLTTKTARPGATSSQRRVAAVRHPAAVCTPPVRRTGKRSRALVSGECGYVRRKLAKMLGFNGVCQGSRFARFLAEIAPNVLEALGKTGLPILLSSGRKGQFFSAGRHHPGGLHRSGHRSPRLNPAQGTPGARSQLPQDSVGLRHHRRGGAHPGGSVSIVRPGECSHTWAESDRMRPGPLVSRAAIL